MEKEKNFKKERTLVIVKPDGIQRSLVGEIIKRYERMGLKMTAIKMVLPNEEHIENETEDHEGDEHDDD